MRSVTAARADSRVNGSKWSLRAVRESASSWLLRTPTESARKMASNFAASAFRASST